MYNGYNNHGASLGINTQLGNSPIPSSPLNSPLISPGLVSPNLDNSWDYHHYNTSLLQPPPSPNGSSSSHKSGTGNTFVHKLYNMVIDDQYQHLISWAYTGLSFIVCNITEFSSEVLPKHFKHNNFSSFVRQLNMYGFHKVNKSPRGHRTLAENQIWEFSHNHFLKNRPDLLDDIKRKVLESDSNRRESTDISSHMVMMQMSQGDIVQKISHLKKNLTQVMTELEETKRTQNIQQNMMKNILDFMTKQHGQLPFETTDIKVKVEPPIYITLADEPSPIKESNFYLPENIIQTQHLNNHFLSNDYNQFLSPSESYSNSF